MIHMTEREWQLKRIRDRRHMRAMRIALIGLPLALCIASALFAAAFWWNH